MIKTFWVKAKHPFLHIIELFSQQQWDKKPETIYVHTSIPVSHSMPKTSTGSNKVIRKQVNLPQWFSLLHYGNQIKKRLVFCWSILTKTLIYFKMWLNSMFEMILGLIINMIKSEIENILSWKQFAPSRKSK